MSMVERVARVLWETSFLRTASGAPGIQDISWQDLRLAALSDDTAKAWFDRTRRQAVYVLTAIRYLDGADETMLLSVSKKCMLDAVVAIDVWDGMIDAALEEG